MPPRRKYSTPLPRNVEWLHHGAVSGIDSFREVSRIVVVGRQAPSPSAVQACAEALTGAACTRLPARQWYQRIDAVHELTDGRLVATERDCHPDSIAEAFRRRITVLELQQIIGRGRGLWRTADNPLHVLVLTDVPLDMPVEELRMSLRSVLSPRRTCHVFIRAPESVGIGIARCSSMLSASRLGRPRRCDSDAAALEALTGLPPS